jgi:tRNA (guanine-N7-)-methyltransferase
MWRAATDSAGYADRIRDILEADPRFANEHPNGEAPRWEGRPVSQFEQRALDADRAIVDLGYRRVA